jgi:predicted nucleic acid-binding protein
LRIGIYDCLYVACAEEEKCELLTADDKLLKNAQQQFPFVRQLSTLP